MSDSCPVCHSDLVADLNARYTPWTAKAVRLLPQADPNAEEAVGMWVCPNPDCTEHEGGWPMSERDKAFFAAKP